MKTITGIIVMSCIILMSACLSSHAAWADNMVEGNRDADGSDIRIQIPSTSAEEETAAKSAIDAAKKEALSMSSGNATVGAVIDRVVQVLKSRGFQNAFINSSNEIYCMGMKGPGEMWKAWIPHPTDKKKVYAILRLKDKAIATLSNDIMSVSVVGDDAAVAEDRAREILAGGIAGIKAADDAGIDALAIIKDGKKLRTEMAGGFKEQYGKASKK